MLSCCLKHHSLPKKYWFQRKMPNPAYSVRWWLLRSRCPTLKYCLTFLRSEHKFLVNWLLVTRSHAQYWPDDVMINILLIPFFFLWIQLQEMGHGDYHETNKLLWPAKIVVKLPWSGGFTHTRPGDAKHKIKLMSPNKPYSEPGSQNNYFHQTNFPGHTTYIRHVPIKKSFAVLTRGGIPIYGATGCAARLGMLFYQGIVSERVSY